MARSLSYGWIFLSSMNISETFLTKSVLIEREKMGYYNPNMVQIPLSSFTYKNQSDAIPDDTGIRYSKWNEDAANFDFTRNIISGLQKSSTVIARSY